MRLSGDIGKQKQVDFTTEQLKSVRSVVCVAFLLGSFVLVWWYIVTWKCILGGLVFLTHKE